MDSVVLYSQANGLDERYNQTIQNMLMKFANDKKELWYEYFDTCVYAYNTSVHESKSYSPFEVMYGHRAVFIYSYTYVILFITRKTINTLYVKVRSMAEELS